MAETLHARVEHTWLIIRVKVFPPKTYALARVHPLQTDGQTDKRTTDDNHANSSTVT